MAISGVLGRRVKRRRWAHIQRGEAFHCPFAAILWVVLLAFSSTPRLNNGRLLRRRRCCSYFHHQRVFLCFWSFFADDVRTRHAHHLLLLLVFSGLKICSSLIRQERETGYMQTPSNGACSNFPKRLVGLLSFNVIFCGGWAEEYFL
jgi:hypothetical protein